MPPPHCISIYTCTTCISRDLAIFFLELLLYLKYLLNNTIMALVYSSIMLAATLAQGPTDPCRREQYRVCGDQRYSPETCIHCISENWNKTGAAGCKVEDDEHFCQVTPAEVKCILDLEKVCGAGNHHTDPALCRACVKTHEEELKEANCTLPWVEEYCHPKPAPGPSPPPPGPPPADKCRREQYAVCGHQRLIPEYCMRCISINWNETGAAGCTIADDEQFCHVTPAEVKCIDALERACGVRHPEGAECDTCVKAHATEIREAGCTDPWVEEYCNPKEDQ
eukprot:m.25862 g.25862  ORF g.25862 m.25862 type:complete len:281 (+) comp4272_c0_seq1:361-1203(+)